jgi:acyl-CoA thioesterase
VSVTNLNFAKASAVERTGEAQWTSEFKEGWGLGGVPNGGYQLAVAVRAAIEATGFPDPLSLNAVYTKRSSEAPVEIKVRRVASGRTTASLHLSMVQAGMLVTEVTALMGSLEGATSQTLWNDPTPDIVPRSECVEMRSSEDAALPPPIVNRMGIWAVEEDTQFAVGQPSGNPVFRGWTRLNDGSGMDVVGAVLATDAFPPPIFNSGANVGWVPTLTLSVQIRKRPTHDWLYGQFSTDSLNGQYLTEEGQLWDKSGDLVAVSRQLALLPK